MKINFISFQENENKQSENIEKIGFFLKKLRETYDEDIYINNLWTHSLNAESDFYLFKRSLYKYENQIGGSYEKEEKDVGFFFTNKEIFFDGKSQNYKFLQEISANKYLEITSLSDKIQKILNNGNFENFNYILKQIYSLDQKIVSQSPNFNEKDGENYEKRETLYKEIEEKLNGSFRSTSQKKKSEILDQLKIYYNQVQEQINPKDTISINGKDLNSYKIEKSTRANQGNLASILISSLAVQKEGIYINLDEIDINEDLDKIMDGTLNEESSKINFNKKNHINFIKSDATTIPLLEERNKSRNERYKNIEIEIQKRKNILYRMIYFLPDRLGLTSYAKYKKETSLFKEKEINELKKEEIFINRNRKNSDEDSGLGSNLSKGSSISKTPSSSRRSSIQSLVNTHERNENEENEEFFDTLQEIKKEEIINSNKDFEFESNLSTESSISKTPSSSRRSSISDLENIHQENEEIETDDDDDKYLDAEDLEEVTEKESKSEVNPPKGVTKEKSKSDEKTPKGATKEENKSEENPLEGATKEESKSEINPLEGITKEENENKEIEDGFEEVETSKLPLYEDIKKAPGIKYTFDSLFSIENAKYFEKMKMTTAKGAATLAMKSFGLKEKEVNRLLEESFSKLTLAEQYNLFSLAGKLELKTKANIGKKVIASELTSEEQTTILKLLVHESITEEYQKINLGKSISKMSLENAKDIFNFLGDKTISNASKAQVPYILSNKDLTLEKKLENIKTIISAIKDQQTYHESSNDLNQEKELSKTKNLLSPSKSLNDLNQEKVDRKKNLLSRSKSSNDLKTRLHHDHLAQEDHVLHSSNHTRECPQNN